MKNITIITTYLMCLFSLSILKAATPEVPKLQQNTPIKLLVVHNSEAPHTNKEHVYQLKAINTTSQSMNVMLIAINSICSNKSKFSAGINLDQKIYTDVNKELNAKNTEELVIPANGEQEFYVKIINTTTLLNQLNCTEIKVMDLKDKIIISNKIEIETFIPDPKDFR
ncbi:MAG: hypothetical protein RJA25_1813 [Bacteroidota bacterium]|mgnify:FL=1|jgi:hypothetical protein